LVGTWKISIEAFILLATNGSLDEENFKGHFERCFGSMQIV
jgi:hypothetical protein